MKNPLFENSHPFVKLVFFIFIILGSFLVLLFLGTIISIPIFDVNFSKFASYFNFKNPENISFIKFMQAVQHIGIYLIPPIIAAYVYSKNPKNYLSADIKSPVYLFIITFLIIMFAIPLNGYFGVINSQMSLPEYLSGLEEKIRMMEENAETATYTFLNVSTIGGLLANLFIVAVLPAVGEEFFFRGILQKLFKDWTKNVHISIFLTAVFFSAFHFQFFSFLPRFFLGMLFGYLLVWSKNIWLPIFAHFINNATAVLVYYFAEDKGKFENAEEALMEPVTLLPALILFGIFIFLFYKSTHKKEPIPYL